MLTERLSKLESMLANTNPSSSSAFQLLQGSGREEHDAGLCFNSPGGLWLLFGSPPLEKSRTMEGWSEKLWPTHVVCLMTQYRCGSVLLLIFLPVSFALSAILAVLFSAWPLRLPMSASRTVLHGGGGARLFVDLEAPPPRSSLGFGWSSGPRRPWRI